MQGRTLESGESERGRQGVQQWDSIGARDYGGNERDSSCFAGGSLGLWFITMTVALDFGSDG